MQGFPFYFADETTKRQKVGSIRKPGPVKLIVGILACDQNWLTRARAMLEPLFRPEEDHMEAVPFHWTSYYREELGDTPLRSFVSYEPLISREELASIKTLTNRLEILLSHEGKRKVNLDPGILTLGQFFLASTKDQRQRTYLQRGIFSEPTLYFKEGRFHPFPWTYHDYRSTEYAEFFLKSRSKLAYQLKHGRPHSQRKAL